MLVSIFTRAQDYIATKAERRKFYIWATTT